MVAVGYMDPGNWGYFGSRWCAIPLYIVVCCLISSLIAMMLQYMAGKLELLSKKT